MIVKQINSIDKEKLGEKFFVDFYNNRVISGTGSFAAYLQQMACNAGQLFVYYDETDAFQRVHDIKKSGSDAMSLTLSAYDGTTVRRIFMDEQYCSDVHDPHLVLQVSAQPSKYRDIFSLMIPAGGTQRFLICRAKQLPPEVSRVHFHKKSNSALRYLETDYVVQSLFERISEMSLFRSCKGLSNRCLYSLLVESLMAKFDQIVCHV